MSETSFDDRGVTRVMGLAWQSGQQVEVDRVLWEALCSPRDAGNNNNNNNNNRGSEKDREEADNNNNNNNNNRGDVKDGEEADNNNNNLRDQLVKRSLKDRLVSASK